jgi:hypothetical protein
MHGIEQLGALPSPNFFSTRSRAAPRPATGRWGLVEPLFGSDYAVRDG